MDPVYSYLENVREILKQIGETQSQVIQQAADLCAQRIAEDGLVHLFSSGHSRILVEEMYPRFGSFPGFHPCVELFLTYHNQVVGANGQRLPDIADFTIDTCKPAGDTLVRVEGLDEPVGPGSTVAGVAEVNALKPEIAVRLVALNHPPVILTSSLFIGEKASAERFEASYNDYRARIQRVYGCE